MCPSLCQMLQKLSLTLSSAGLEITSEAGAESSVQEREHIFKKALSLGPLFRCPLFWPQMFQMHLNRRSFPTASSNVLSS